jgi:hypothetical protein
MAPAQPAPLRCPSCGSTRIRRSLPQDGWERFLRAIAPVHYYRCRECNHRGWTWGPVLLSDEAAPPNVPVRPPEVRDATAAAVRRRRALFLVVVAVGAGIAMGFMAERCAPPPTGQALDGP